MDSAPVRASLGRGWLDTVAQSLVLDRLDDNMWLYLILFEPVICLAETKVRAYMASDCATAVRQTFQYPPTPLS
jgi:hypothetical protein